jgi:hypothetical protein
MDYFIERNKDKIDNILDFSINKDNKITAFENQITFLKEE